MSVSRTPSRSNATANRPRSRPKLQERALAWGWPAERIRVLDGDQGRSGTTTVGRDDFAWLLSEIALGHVGLVLCFQINRLAREDEDCCRLIKVCAAFDTLLADQDGLYHPHDFNDRMLLTIKGFMGGFELHQLQQRMQAGRLNRCRRGEWLGQPPPGYVVGPDGKLQFDPDEQVQEVLRLVLEQIRVSWGASARSCATCGSTEIQLPFRPVGGPERGQLQWRPPHRETLRQLVRNPAYAGCLHLGSVRDGSAACPAGSARQRSRPPRARGLPGVPSRQSPRVHDAGSNTRPTSAASSSTAGAARSPVRRGRRWRSWPGLVVCGECGCRMQTHYTRTSAL